MSYLDEEEKGALTLLFKLLRVQLKKTSPEESCGQNDLSFIFAQYDVRF